jgi:hypothetical protein
MIWASLDIWLWWTRSSETICPPFIILFDKLNKLAYLLLPVKNKAWSLMTLQVHSIF